MLAAFFGPASAGFFTLARMVMGMPSNVVGKSVGDVFYPRIAEAAHQSENLTRLIIKATVGLAAVGVLPYGIVIAFGPFLFGLVFGSEWVTAGEYARWMALAFFFGFLHRPSMHALPVLKAQGVYLIFSCFSITTRSAVLFAGYYFFESDVVAVAFFGISGMMLYTIPIIIILHLSKGYDRRTLAGA